MAAKSALTDTQKVTIHETYLSSQFLTQQDLADIYGVCRLTINKAIKEVSEQAASIQVGRPYRTQPHWISKCYQG
jgi:biotin operon repressor